MVFFRKFCFIGFCLILLIPTLILAGEERESCQLCGMWIDQYQRTGCELVYNDGKTEHTCGVACMLRIVQEKGVNSFRSIHVKDWNKGATVDAQNAWYSIGSQLIPDMLPNFIAFADRKDAEAFAAEKGGVVLGFVGAMDTISPRGQTQPFRIRQAVTPGQGSLGLGVAYAYMLKDSVKVGTDGQNPESFINNNPAQPRAPKKMEVQTQSLIANYGITDRLAMQMNLPYYERSMDTLVRQGNQVNTVNARDDGIGDLAGEVRYNLWRSDFYDKFFTLLAGITLPTGDFDSTRAFNAALKTDLISTAPGMQQGAGTPTYLGGLLYSHKWESFWFHGQAVYRVSPKNSNDYKFGDEYQGGLAVHYTPHYDIMLGVEMDASRAMKNEDRGIEIGNTGGTRANLAFVFDWRFLNAFGGNLNLRGSVGLPVYEDLNSQDFVNAGGRTYTQTQLGEGFFASLVINFNTRFGQY
ncbi:MAG: nitrous oxide reductase accessory protein NosL [Deltaproteobacteria bacterium]|nr:nitrous oxide reductase accessory protein NosL [Deltaproteobacteria bacterium]